ncbi:MAG TPA: ADP-ribose pyrophosphatase, partial [Burkholderiales bacterium]|nr:ADP-ribose pyrophosphatase [Burkholderiales bacterium]
MKQSKRSDLTEHFVSGGQVFDGKLLKVYRDTVRLPDGSEGGREYIRHPGAVAIVALFDDGRLLLERQFRYPNRREF